MIDKDEKVLTELKNLIDADFPENKIIFNGSSFTKKK